MWTCTTGADFRVSLKCVIHFIGVSVKNFLWAPDVCVRVAVHIRFWWNVNWAEATRAFASESFRFDKFSLLHFRKMKNGFRSIGHQPKINLRCCLFSYRDWEILHCINHIIRNKTFHSASVAEKLMHEKNVIHTNYTIISILCIVYMCSGIQHTHAALRIFVAIAIA